jgi:prepilin-type N-terminal cleavage/methylation domain-containing protein
MNKRGFTLIELIIVIALLSVIAAIAVPKYSDMRELSLIKTDLYNSKSIIELARLEVTKYGEIDGIKISELTESSDTPSIEVIPSNFKYLENTLQTQNTASKNSNRNYVLKYNVKTKKFYVDDHGAMWPVIEGSSYYKCDWKGKYKYIDCTKDEYENVYKDGYK